MTGGPAWHIDAIDVRAGRAVATFREENLLEPGAVFDTGASIFVAPPLFVPEFLRSRATGFGLARGHAQIGLFLDDTLEVSFPSIDAVAEFVRRVYLRGSGGDGPGESGGAPPRAPEGGTDPTGLEPSPTEDKADPVNVMIAFAASCEQHSRLCSHGEAKPLPNSLIDLVGQPESPGWPAHRPLPHPSDRLLRGARRISMELLARVGSGNPIEWSLSAQRLIAVLCRLGITPHSLPLPPLSRFTPAFSRSPTVDHLFSLLTESYSGFTPHWPSQCFDFCSAGVPAADPFEDLAFLPVSTYPWLLAPNPNLPASNISDNVQALLSAFVATPAATLVSMSSPAAEASAELVLFAACYLTLGVDRSLGIYASNDPAWVIMADRLVNRALGWLADNVPKLVFEPEVEALIVGASGVLA